MMPAVTGMSGGKILDNGTDSGCQYCNGCPTFVYFEKKSWPAVAPSAAALIQFYEQYMWL